MAWPKRLPASFPRRYREAMQEAIRMSGIPITFSFCTNNIDAEKDADSFRHYRWCIRQNPNADPELTTWEREWRFRLSNHDNVLYLTAMPARDLSALNPHLAGLIQSVAD